MFNPDIYRAYDIRGIVPGDFDAKEGYHLGRSRGWNVLPRLNSVMEEEGIELTRENHKYYAWCLTIPPGHMASVRSEARLREVMSVWKGRNPQRGEIAL